MTLKTLLTALLTIIGTIGARGAVTVTGGQYPPVETEAQTNAGVDQVFVVYSAADATITYKAAGSTAVVGWQQYDSYGEAYAKPVTEGIERSGATVRLKAPKANKGYIISEGAKRTVVWIADYNTAPFDAEALTTADDASDCNTLTLRFEGTAARITGYGPTGRTFEIDRRIGLQWNTLDRDSESDTYVTTQHSATRAWLPEQFTIAAPLCATAVTLTGDRFLQAWGMAQSIATSTIEPTAVEAFTTATQAERDASNEQKIEGVELGGSAPVDITFTAHVTPAALFTEWQMAADAEFDMIDYRSSDLEFTYTFTEMGTTYVRFVAANADASCDYYSDTYTVTVGESSLVIPNAFSPGSSEGVNDQWKVSYKSLVRFQCHIFNKWGEKMAEFSDPSQGWDGKYRGKLVPAGVYYYVIEADGSDGRHYKRAGDINIVNHR